MATIAILAEKPSQARHFADALGGMRGTYNGENYVITASRGHLFEYAKPEAQVAPDLVSKYFGWDLKNLPWNPNDIKWKRVKGPDTTKTLKDIKAVFSEADEIVIGTDWDPTGEGELLAWEVIDELGFAHGKGKKFSRMHFADESAKEIQKAFANRAPIQSMETDREFIKAQYRSQWDWMSMQFTRIATKFGNGQDVLRQGRLKSAMIVLVGDQLAKVDAYEEIPFYSNRFRDENDNMFVSAEEPVFEKREDVPQKYSRAHVVVDSKTRKRTAPQKLIDLARLSSILAPKGISAQQVLDTYQRLYTDSVVSYPRTEDKCITVEQFNELLPKVDQIARLVGVDPALLTHRVPRKTHVKEGMAHGANRPGPNVPHDLDALNARYGVGASEIYTVLAKNYLAMLAEDYEYEQQKGHLQEYPDFKGTCNVPLAWGWKAVSSDASDDDLDPDDPGKGLGTIADPFIYEGFPPKPQYPTMKWLMTQLEKHNVGTGATRTSTYSEVTSGKKWPLLRDKKGKIEMAFDGQMSYGLLPGTHIGDLALTEQVMDEMDGIAKGTFDPAVGLAKIADYVRDDIKTMEANSKAMHDKLGVTVVEKTYAEQATGIWNGQPVSFKREFSQHRFTDDEVAALCAGEVIQFQAVSSKTGRTYTAAGTLAKREYNGRKYVGFKLDLDLVDDSKAPCPDQWCGHAFTAAEKQALEAGKSVHLDGVKSKAGNVFSCDVIFGEEDGRKCIIPQFSGSTNGGIPAAWCGHTFNEQERRDLEAGRFVHIDGAVSKTGKKFNCDVTWGEDENGHMRIIPSFGGDQGVPDQWCGHVFTAAEKQALESNQTVHIDGAVSKAGKVFSCDVVFAEEDGRKRIIPQFGR